MNYDKKALFAMGLAYATHIPVVELEGNNVIYPPLPGFSRRPFVGKDRFEHAQEYLTNLESQHISDEALVYYELMKKFNS